MRWILALILAVPAYAQNGAAVFPGGGGGVGVGAANVVGTCAGTVTTCPVTITTLALTSSTQNTAIVDCYASTGGAKLTITALAFTGGPPLTTVTPTFTPSTTGVYCTVNSNGGAGTNGNDGVAATIAVGTVTPLAAGATPTIVNAGSSSAATFNFGIPAGAAGSGNNALCVDATGSATAYTCPTPSPTVSTLTGLLITFIPQTTNGANPQLNVSGLGFKNMLQSDGSTAIAASAMTGGSAYIFSYNGSALVQSAGAATGPVTGCTTSGTNVLQKSNGAGGCAASSLSDDGTTVSTAEGIALGSSPPALTAGSGGVVSRTEGTAPSIGPASGYDVCYADSTQHGELCSYNNAGYLPRVLGPASSTSGNVAVFGGTNGGAISDAGFLGTTVVRASSPGAGISRFAGGTQVATSAELSGDATTSGSNVVVVAKVNGTSIPTNSAADQVPVTTASATGAWKTLPNCGDSSHALAYSTSTHTWSCQSVTGTAGSPSYPINPQTSTYSVVTADFTSCKNITVASGTFTATLVSSGAQPTNGQCVMFTNYGSGVVTIARNGQNINGAAANLTLSAGSASAPTGVLITSNGTDYFAQTFGTGGGGTPGGSTTQLQYNNAGAFGGMADYTYDGSHTETLGAAGILDASLGQLKYAPQAPYFGAANADAICAAAAGTPACPSGGASTQTGITEFVFAHYLTLPSGFPASTRLMEFNFLFDGASTGGPTTTFKLKWCLVANFTYTNGATACSTGGGTLMQTNGATIPTNTSLTNTGRYDCFLGGTASAGTVAVSCNNNGMARGFATLGVASISNPTLVAGLPTSGSWVVYMSVAYSAATAGNWIALTGLVPRYFY